MPRRSKGKKPTKSLVKKYSYLNADEREIIRLNEEMTELKEFKKQFPEEWKKFKRVQKFKKTR